MMSLQQRQVGIIVPAVKSATGSTPEQGASEPDAPLAEQSVRRPVAATPPFSVYNTREKWAIIALASFAGLFSPLTASTYFPAIQTIADAFHTSVELINVTVTVYMVLQGTSPMVWGTLSDRVGRRLMFLSCLGLLSVSCVGMALVPTNAYWLLVLLRCIQAAGSASMIALGSGTIADIAEPSERGGFMGLFALGPLMGPCIGPIIGGVLTGSLGWRAIFWFLTITSVVYLVFLFLVFPETLRTIVGDGSIPPPHYNRPVFPLFTKYVSSATAPRPPPRKSVNPLRLFMHPSVVLILLFNGMIYAVFYSVTATLSPLFAEAYPFLSESELGLCFLSIGVGSATGSYTNGRMLDADYKRTQQRLDGMTDAQDGEKGQHAKAVNAVGETEADFPIEYARLRRTPFSLTLFVLSTIGYGWSVQRAVHLACPLILQFIIGFTTIYMMTTSQTLLMDLFPSQGGSVTAVNNLVRCSMGATLVAIIDFILRAMRPGWTFVVLCGLCVLMWPMSWAVIRFGPHWRARRRLREERK